MIKAVLFDFDGVIANTMEYHVEAWNKALTDFGVSIKTADLAAEEGANADEIARNLLRKKNIELNDNEIDELTIQKRKIYRRITRAGVIPETGSLIKKLKSNAVRIGLVTGSVRSSIKRVVDEAFLSQFDVVITSEDVAANKPAPDPYLTAARKLNVDSDACVVIENAPKGIEAAKRAGMTCIALRTTIKDDSILSDADVIVDNALEIDFSNIETKEDM